MAQESEFVASRRPPQSGSCRRRSGLDKLAFARGNIVMLRAGYRAVMGVLPDAIATPIRHSVRAILNRAPPAETEMPAAKQPPDLKWRFDFAESYYKDVRANIDAWAHNSRENDNFTYDLTDRNLSYLAATVATVTTVSINQIESYLREPASDLFDYLSAKAASLPIDHPTSFGRRLGWYAFARAVKPRVIVETGIQHGLGSVLLCSALRRNAMEGANGRYFGTDIDTSAGVLLGPPFDQSGNILYGDSIESLQRLNETIDLFINDSDHSAEYEYREYQVIRSKLSKDAIILGDNAHATDSLLRFSKEERRSFLFFKEQPKDHWYPGAGIGISFVDRDR